MNLQKKLNIAKGLYQKYRIREYDLIGCIGKILQGQPIDGSHYDGATVPEMSFVIDLTKNKPIDNNTHPNLSSYTPFPINSFLNLLRRFNNF
jgi:hypothetical protein